MARPAFSLTAADPMSSVIAEVQLGPARLPGNGWRGGSVCEELKRQTLVTGRRAVSRKGSPAQRHPSQSQDSSCSKWKWFIYWEDYHVISIIVSTGNKSLAIILYLAVTSDISITPIERWGDHCRGKWYNKRVFLYYKVSQSSYRVIFLTKTFVCNLISPEKLWEVEWKFWEMFGKE